MKKKVFVALAVLVLACLGVGIFFFGKKDNTVPEETAQLPVDNVLEEVVQVPVDETCIDLLKKMKIVKDAAEFGEELLGKSCDKYQAYEMLNTMKGQDGAVVSSSYQGQQMTQNELLTLYLKELFGIDVKEAAGENFEAYADNYGTNKCPAREVYDEATGRTYYFVDYFGNSYNSSTAKNSYAIGSSRTRKELLLRPYLSQQNMTAHGTGFVFLRYPGCQAYLYDIETQTMKYIDTITSNVEGALHMYLAKSDTLYYIKEVDEKFGVYRKDLKSDSEPEKIVDIKNSEYIHVTNDEKYASIYSISGYSSRDGEEPFIRVDIENKEVEIVQYHFFKAASLLPGSNVLNHIKINPAYPELFFFAHDYSGQYYMNCLDRVNIMNVDTGEIITVTPGVWEGEFRNNLTTYNICFTHESWSENGEYLYITNLCGDGGDDVPDRGMIRVNKDGTHRKYITNPELNDESLEVEQRLLSSHGSASGDRKEAIHAKAGNYAYFNIDTSIVDSVNDTVTITFDYYDNAAQDMKLIYTKALEDVKDNCHIENGSADITCTNTGEWKQAEIVVHGDFETSGNYGTDFKIGSAASDIYITNIQVKKGF